MSKGSRSARGARRRTETAYKAEGGEASWHMTAKPNGAQPTVNAALVHRQFACQQPRRLAHGTDPGDAAGDVQRVVESARLGQRERPVVQGAGLLDITASSSVPTG